MREDSDDWDHVEFQPEWARPRRERRYYDKRFWDELEWSDKCVHEPPFPRAPWQGYKPKPRFPPHTDVTCRLPMLTHRPHGVLQFARGDTTTILTLSAEPYFLHDGDRSRTWSPHFEYHLLTFPTVSMEPHDIARLFGVIDPTITRELESLLHDLVPDCEYTKPVACVRSSYVDWPCHRITIGNCFRKPPMNRNRWSEDLLTIYATVFDHITDVVATLHKK